MATPEGFTYLCGYSILHTKRCTFFLENTLKISFAFYDPKVHKYELDNS